MPSDLRESGSTEQDANRRRFVGRTGHESVARPAGTGAIRITGLGTAERWLWAGTMLTRASAAAGWRLVRRRLQALSTAGLVATYPYATIGRGAVNYYKLTPLGFQVLNGPHVPNRK